MNSKYILNKMISLFSGPISNIKVKENIALHKTFSLIKDHQYYGDVTERLRRAKTKEDFKKIKDNELDYVTISGVFSERKDKALIEHSKLIVIDLDNFSSFQQLAEIRKILCSNEKNLNHMVICFVSPSGKGLKMVYLIDHKSYTQAENIRGIWNYLYREIKVPKEVIDTNGKDISRACFLCHDPNAFLNPKLLKKAGEITPFDPKPYLKKKKKSKTKIPIVNDHDDHNVYFKMTSDMMKSEGFEFEAGQRNNYIFRTATLLNGFGVPESIAFKELDRLFELDKYEEHSKAFSHIYENKKCEFGKYRKRRSNSDQEVEVPIQPLPTRTIEDCNSSKDDEGVSPTYSTPCINRKIVKQLPYLLRAIAEYYEDNERKRDTATFTLLGIASAAIPNVICIHDNKKFYPNNIFIIQTNYGVGKGVADRVKDLWNPLHKMLKVRSINEKNRYDDEMEIYNLGKKKGLLMDKPRKPKYYTFYIPVDITAPAFKHKLVQCGGKNVVLFTSELDTLVAKLNSIHGGMDLSTLLRKGAMNETISFATKDYEGEIEEPAFAMVLTGTPSSVPTVANVENGTFSRIGFYAYNSAPNFSNEAFDSEKYDTKNDLFDRIAQDFLNMYLELEKLEEEGKSIVFRWKKEHKDVLYPKFYEMTDENKKFITNGEGIIFRMGLRATRIATLLTVLRIYEKTKMVNMERLENVSIEGSRIYVECTKEDFENTLHLVDILEEHGYYVYSNLPKEATKPMSPRGASKRKVYGLLPDRFKRGEILDDILVKTGFKARIIGDYLKELTDAGLLLREGNGWYSKSNKH